MNMISGFKENNGDRTVIKDVDPNAIEILVNYIYSTYEIKNVITGDNVQDLLAAANLLQLWEVKEECCKFLLNGLDLTNCFNIKSVAKGYDCPKLLAATTQFIATNFKKIVDTSEFYGLEHQEVSDLIASDNINAPNEEKVYESVVAWVKHDAKIRSQHLPSLMHHVRLPLISQDYLTALINNEDPLFEGYPECQRDIKEALRFHLNGRKTIDPSSSRPRPSIAA